MGRVFVHFNLLREGKIMSKKLNKLGAIFMTSMLVATMSFTAFAVDAVPGETGGSTEGIVDGSEITIGKDVTTDGKTMAPVTTFNLNVTAGDAVAEDETFGTLYAGVMENVQITDAEFGTDADSEGSIYKGEFKIDVSDVVYPHAGIFVYNVNEVKGSYAGMTYDVDANDNPNQYKMYVFVENDTESESGGLKITHVTFADAEGEKVQKITNDYGENNGLVHDIKITKKVSGNAADMTQKFKFTVTVTPGSGSNANEQYKVIIPGAGDDGADKEVILTTDNGHSTSYDNVMDGTEIFIYGLTDDDSILVVEDGANTLGYTSTYQITNNGNNSMAAAAELTADGVTTNALADEAVLTIENHRDNVTPTGVAMDVAPYALMLVLAGGAAVTFFRKRQYFED